MKKAPALAKASGAAGQVSQLPTSQFSPISLSGATPGQATNFDDIPSPDVYAAVKRQFESVGLDLYPLERNSLWISFPRGFKGLMVPDLRSAQEFLRHFRRVHG